MAKKKETTPPHITSVILDANKDKFPAVIVLGVSEDGNINLDSNLTTYPMIQYILNKASFNLFAFETSKKEVTE